MSAEIDREAQEWAETSGTAINGTLNKEFTRWLSSDPAHLAAYQRKFRERTEVDVRAHIERTNAATGGKYRQDELRLMSRVWGGVTIAGYIVVTVVVLGLLRGYVNSLPPEDWTALALYIVPRMLLVGSLVALVYAFPHRNYTKHLDMMTQTWAVSVANLSGMPAVTSSLIAEVVGVKRNLILQEGEVTEEIAGAAAKHGSRSIGAMSWLDPSSPVPTQPRTS